MSDSLYTPLEAEIEDIRSDARHLASGYRLATPYFERLAELFMESDAFGIEWTQESLDEIKTLAFNEISLNY